MKYKYIYNKLVRDKIPENINKGNNKKAIYRILDEKEYIKELNKKLLEEANEFIEENDKEELADLFEVIEAIIKYKDIDKNEVEEIKKNKKIKKGAFKEKIYLEYVEEEKENNKEEKSLINNIDAARYIGKTLTVKMDRPLGSKHPKYEDLIYLTNYGYIADTISGDGEELDCYILGEFKPLEEYKGKCIAVIHRLNDNDDKLIIVPEGKEYTKEEIRVLTEYQERYFESKIIM